MGVDQKSQTTSSWVPSVCPVTCETPCRYYILTLQQPWMIGLLLSLYRGRLSNFLKATEQMSSRARLPSEVQAHVLPWWCFVFTSLCQGSLKGIVRGTFDMSGRSIFFLLGLDRPHNTFIYCLWLMPFTDSWVLVWALSHTCINSFSHLYNGKNNIHLVELWG